MSEQHTQRANEILSTIRYATLATASQDNKPWNNPVAHMFDQDMNLYWVSDRQNRHSRNVRANESIAIVIYDSTVPAGSEWGVYFEATASELNDPDAIEQAISQVLHAPESVADLSGEANRRIYKAVLKNAWMNDAEYRDGKFYRDYRVELPLEDLRVALRR